MISHEQHLIRQYFLRYVRQAQQAAPDERAKCLFIARVFETFQFPQPAKDAE